MDLVNGKYVHVGRNLYHNGSTYYRLYAKCITPNNCWLAGAELRELVDIDASSGKDVVPLECGIVPAHRAYISY